MTEARFQELLKVTGPIAPEGLEAYVGDLEADEKTMLPVDFLQYVLDLNHVPAVKQEKIFAALDEINAIPELVELAQVMAKDVPRALNRCTANMFFQPKPECLTGFAKEAYAFLYTQLCVLEGRKELRRRGVPEKYDLDIPERMTRKQLGKYVATSKIDFDDYNWDINFYGCAIFLLDRFYFIPYKWEESPLAWRNVRTGQVKALWKAGVAVRGDGQLDGVNGIFDPQAFKTVFEEDERCVRGNLVSPEGFVLHEVVELDKAEWKPALCEGDYLIALHIPGGEGYTPERVKLSCELALEFFDKYYPEYNYKGFWSESWLYDPGLAKILGPQRNISRVQKQFYNYPTMEGDDMARHEVLHDPKADYRQMKPKSTLEKGLFDAWDRGERFHTTGMFLLREEIPAVGTDPYWKEE